MNPVTFIQAAIVAFAAFVFGGLIFGIGGYYYGHAKGEASKMASIGALQTSVSSCKDAATAAKKLADSDRAASEIRETSLREALAESAKARPKYRVAVDRAMAYQPKGDTECARTVDAVRTLVMGGAR